MKRKVTIFLVFLLTFNSFSQDKNNLFLNETSSVKDYFIASGQMLFFNLLVYDGVSLFSQNPPKTSFEVLKTNLSNPWIFDFSSFQRNQIYHPYFGSLYFISGRSNNLNFLESFLLGITGSFIWEAYLEGPAPSLNDFITTPVSGAITGEILHRLSNSVYDSSILLSWIISPVDAMNEILRGKRGGFTQGLIYSQNYSLNTGATFQNNSYADKIMPQAGGAINIVYGDPYGHTSKEFYDQFTVDLYYTGWKNNNFLKLNMDGLLYSHTIFPSENIPSTLGISLDYDVIFSDYENLSNGSAGLCLKQSYNNNFNYSIQADYIYLSSSDIFFITKDSSLGYSISAKQPEYTFKHGPELKINLEFLNKTLGNLFLNCSLQYVMPYSRTSSDSNLKSDTLIFITDTSYEHFIYKDFYLGIRNIFILKNEFNNALSKDFQTINKTDFYVKYYLN